MSDLISREKVLDLWHLRLSDEEIYKAICDMQPADIMECARAIKEYCEKRNGCDGCEFDTGFFSCGFNGGDCPFDWDLPESEDT